MVTAVALIVVLLPFGSSHGVSPPSSSRWSRSFRDRLALGRIRLSAARGRPEAQVQMAAASSQGFVVDRDSNKAIAWYRLAARPGVTRGAQFALGEMYSLGQGVPVDSETGAELVAKAAESGHFTAQYRLADAYSRGLGVARSPCEDVQVVAAHGGRRLIRAPSRTSRGRWRTAGAQKGIPREQSPSGQPLPCTATSSRSISSGPPMLPAPACRRIRPKPYNSGSSRRSEATLDAGLLARSLPGLRAGKRDLARPGGGSGSVPSQRCRLTDRWPGRRQDARRSAKQFARGHPYGRNAPEGARSSRRSRATDAGPRRPGTAW